MASIINVANLYFQFTSVDCKIHWGKWYANVLMYSVVISLFLTWALCILKSYTDEVFATIRNKFLEFFSKKFQLVKYISKCKIFYSFYRFEYSFVSWVQCIHLQYMYLVIGYQKTPHSQSFGSKEELSILNLYILCPFPGVSYSLSF